MSYIYSVLEKENVFGHTKKVQLLRQSLDNTRSIKNGNLRILDIGCGNGFAVTRFLAHTNDEILGIDFHEASIEYANKHFANANLQFRVQDAEKMIMENEKFDVVVFSDILEHVYDPQKLLNIASALLNKNGLCLVTIPNGFGPFELESFIYKIPVLGFILYKGCVLITKVLDKTLLRNKWNIELQNQTGRPYNSESGHVQFFSYKKISSLFANSNFVVEQQKNLSLFCGPFTNTLFAPFNNFCKLNNNIADKVIPKLSSAWFFSLKNN